MKINNILASASMVLGQLFCCGCLSSLDQRVDSVKEVIVQQNATRAAFDIGSGEVKIVVCDVDITTNKVTKTWFSKFTVVKLREDLVKSQLLDPAHNQYGCLSPEIEQQLIAALNAMKREAERFHPQKWVGVATSVFRTAKNGQEVLDRVQAATGLKIELLPQVEEGKVGFATAVAASNRAPEEIIAWDSGSGSFQLSTMVNGQLEVYGAEFAKVPAFEALFAQRNLPYSDTSPNPVHLEESLQLIETISKKLPPIKPWMVDNKKQLVAIGGGSDGIFEIGRRVIGHSPFTKEEIWVAIQELSGKDDKYLSRYGKTETIMIALNLMYAVMDHCGFENVDYYSTNGSCAGVAITPYFWNDHYVDFILVRHGETFWNEKKEMINPKDPSGPKIMGPIVQGSSDIELNKQGELQAEQAADMINDKKLSFKKLITSNLKRAAKTAHIIGQKIGLVPEEDLGFSAAGWGECEGRSHKYRSSAYAYDMFGNYRGSSPDWKRMTTRERWSFSPIPGAEPPGSTIERMKAAFLRIANEAQDKDRILVVTHSENMKVFIADCQQDLIENLRLNSKFAELEKIEAPKIDNCSLHKFRFDRVTEEFSYLGTIN